MKTETIKHILDALKEEYPNVGIIIILNTEYKELLINYTQRIDEEDRYFATFKIDEDPTKKDVYCDVCMQDCDHTEE